MWHKKNKGAWMCIIDNRKRIEKVNFELGHERNPSLKNKSQVFRIPRSDAPPQSNKELHTFLTMFATSLIVVIAYLSYLKQVIPKICVESL